MLTENGGLLGETQRTLLLATKAVARAPCLHWWYMSSKSPGTMKVDSSGCPHTQRVVMQEGSPELERFVAWIVSRSNLPFMGGVPASLRIAQYKFNPEKPPE